MYVVLEKNVYKVIKSFSISLRRKTFISDNFFLLRIIVWENCWNTNLVWASIHRRRKWNLWDVVTRQWYTAVSGENVENHHRRFGRSNVIFCLFFEIIISYCAVSSANNIFNCLIVSRANKRVKVRVRVHAWTNFRGDYFVFENFDGNSTVQNDSFTKKFKFLNFIFRFSLKWHE